MLSKNRKLLLLSFIFIIILFIGNQIINTLLESKQKYYLSVQSQLFETKYKTSYRYYKIMSDDIYKMYMQNKRLQQLLSQLKNADEEKKNTIRTEVYKLLSRNYKRLTHMGISQVQFHLPNNTSFLRMYAPDSYGDDLSQTRDTVLYINAYKKPVEGLESCIYMVGYRFVYPIIIDNKMVASVEISYDTQRILDAIADDYVYDAHILIPKAMAPHTIIQRELGTNYKKTWESEDYYIEVSTHKELKDQNFYDVINTPELKEEIEKGMLSKKIFSVDVIYNYKHIVISFLPIPNIRVKNLPAYIVTYTPSNYLSDINLEKNYTKSLFVSVVSLLFFFFIYVLLSREKLKALALYDALTKLPNRTLFMIEYQAELNRAFRYNTKVALMFIDLDGFKVVNDKYGHQAGDEVLKKTAEIFKEKTRETDIVSRFAGDEFTIVLPDIKGEAEAIAVAESIIKELNKEMRIAHEVIKIGASIGVSIYPNDSRDIHDLIKHADLAMYQAKQQGKNSVILHKETK